MKPRVSDAILRRMDNFTPSPTVPTAAARRSLGSLETEKLVKAQTIAGNPCTRTWQGSNSTADALPAEITNLHTPTDDNEAELLVDEKSLLQQASANFKDAWENSHDTVPQPSEGVAADK